MWSKLVELIKAFAPDVIKKYVVSAILKLVGVSGGVWTWIMTNVIMKVVSKVIKALETKARMEDQENIDEKLNEKYQDQIKKGADEKDLIDSETSLLNGGRKP